MNRRKLAYRYFLAVFYAGTITISPLVFANPTDGVISAGSAIISTPNAQTTVINQSTNKAVIDWQSFNIASNEKTQFIQPSSSAITLNRVNSTNGVSQIFGALTANGQIILVNPAGIYFGPTARVDAAGLLATTANITNKDFMNNNFEFKQESNFSGSVINDGHIKISDNGMAALVAPGVANNGIITANLGTVELSSGTHYTVDFYGNKLIQFAPDSIVTSTPRDQNGNILSNAVSNSGKIYANGGTIILSANAAKNVVDNVINMTGVIQANTVSQHNGEIILSGGSEGNVLVSGKLKAHTIKIKGHNTKITGTLTTDQNGYLETSGDYLDVNQAVLNLGSNSTWLLDPYNIDVVSTLTAINNSGIPAFIPQGNDSQVLNINIDQQLNNGINVILNTSGNITSPGTQLGDINVNAPISVITNNPGNLTLNANNNININADINSTGGLILNAPNNITNNITAPGNINVNSFILQSGNFYQVNSSLPAFTSPSNFQINYGAQFIRALGGVGSQTNPFLLTDVYGLQGIGSNNTTLLYDYYKLNNNIDANMTSAWNNGKGFLPLGAVNTNNAYYNYGSYQEFSGGLDGNNYAIQNLTINLPNTANVGLFYYNIGIIKNLSLSGLVTGYYTVGALAAYNIGTIENISSSVNVTGTDSANGFEESIGGLIGINYGGSIDGSIISNINSSGTVTGVNSVGGLVGKNFGLLNGSQTNSSLSNNSTPQIYFNGIVNGNNNIGGIVGINDSSPILGASSTGTVENINECFLSICQYNANVNVVGIGTLTGGGSNAGGIVGFNRGGNVNNINFGATVTGDTRVGGIIGYNSSSANANNLIFNGTVIGINSTGGLIGQNDGIVSATTTSLPPQNSPVIIGLPTLTSSMEVFGTVTGDDNTGGFIGFNTGTVSGLRTDLSSITITPGSDAVGGIIGYNSGKVSNVTSNVTVNGGFEVGGVIGWNVSGAQVGNISSSSDVIGLNSTGGLIGQNDAVLDTTVDVGGFPSTFTFTGELQGGIHTGGFVGYNTGTVNGISASANEFTIEPGADNVGAIIGTNSGTASNLTSEMNVTGDFRVGGVIGANTGQVLGLISSTGTITGSQRVGGLIGENDASIDGNYTTFSYQGTITKGSQVGGFIGYNTGSINKFQVTQPINWGIFLGDQVGGIIGYNSGTVTNSSSLIPVYGNNDVGGFIGYNDRGAVLINDYSTGSVSGFTTVGGFIGYNNALLDGNNNIYSTGTLNSNSIFGGAFFGGFVGVNGPSGIIQNFSYTVGNINLPYSYEIGGIVGENTGLISDSSAHNTVIGYNRVGGVTGYNTNSGTLNYVYNTGDISGDVSVGGVAGQNDGSISNAYNLANVTGIVANNPFIPFFNATNNSTNIGGVVGLNSASGIINTAFNFAYTIPNLANPYFTTTNISTNNGKIYNTVSGETNVGGFVGQNMGSIQNAYNLSQVLGANNVGGFVGSNTGSTAQISNAYNAGPVIGSTTSTTGAFAGVNNATSASPLINDVWNNQLTGVNTPVGSGSANGLMGLSTSAMTNSANYPGSWNFGNAWAIDDNHNSPIALGRSYPYLLINFPQNYIYYPGIFDAVIDSTVSKVLPVIIPSVSLITAADSTPDVFTGTEIVPDYNALVIAQTPMGYSCSCHYQWTDNNHKSVKSSCGYSCNDEQWKKFKKDRLLINDILNPFCRWDQYRLVKMPVIDNFLNNNNYI